MSTTPVRRDASAVTDDRAGDRRHDLRVVRQPHRAQAQQARRGDRHGQLRHREGAGAGTRGRRPRRRSSRRSRPATPLATPELPRRRRPPLHWPTTAGPDPTRALRDRLVTSVVLAVPVIALAMVPALQFTYWQWISLALAAPVVVWAAWPFHRAAWANLRHGAATMDTLVSLGVLAAFGWSLWALLFGTAGVPGMTHPFELTIGREPTARATSTSRSPPGSPRSSSPAATSRPAPSAAPAPRCGRCSSSAPRTSPCCATARRGADPDRAARGRRPVRRPARREDRHRRRGRGGQLGRRRLDAHRRVGAGRGRPGDAVVGATVNAGGRLVVRATRVGADTQLAQMADARRGGPERQGRGPAPRRPDLRRVRADRHRPRRRHPRRSGSAPAPARPPRSPPRSPC